MQTDRLAQDTGHTSPFPGNRRNLYRDRLSYTPRWMALLSVRTQQLCVQRSRISRHFLRRSAPCLPSTDGPRASPCRPGTFPRGCSHCHFSLRRLPTRCLRCNGWINLGLGGDVQHLSTVLSLTERGPLRHSLPITGNGGGRHEYETEG
jgi:hypothetical protein